MIARPIWTEFLPKLSCDRLLYNFDDVATEFNKNVNQQYIHTKIYIQDHVFSTTGALYTGWFFTGPALKVLCMELVPSNKEIDWFRHKSAKYGIGPTLKTRLKMIFM